MKSEYKSGQKWPLHPDFIQYIYASGARRTKVGAGLIWGAGSLAKSLHFSGRLTLLYWSQRFGCGCGCVDLERVRCFVASEGCIR